MSNGAAGYHFLPWVRFGAMVGARPDPRDATRLKLPVKLRVNAVAADDVAVPLTFYGPGDVTGIDPREIIRTEPRHLTPDFPPHLFASVEFDRPDFPWLFTPASADADRLRPWITLAVVRKRAATLSADPRRPLVKLTCPVAELPDLTESWSWAHGVYVGSLDGHSVNKQLADRPHQARSRLLCPRQLEPSQGGADTGYYAFLVPTFEVGRKAGLGQALTKEETGSLQLAWNVTAAGEVELPVYYQWEFGTGPAGDFEDAVDRLQMLRTPPNTSPPRMDASMPAANLGPFPGALAPLASALRPVGQQPAPLPQAFAALRQALRQALETPLGTGTSPQPPIYGRWQSAGAGVHGDTLPAPGSALAWLSDLNLDPRYRAAAALGAQVVQRQQEQLVAAAWEQAGEARSMNQWLRQKQLGREVTRAVHGRLSELSPESLQQITAPLAVTAAAPPASALAATASRAAAQAEPVDAMMSAAFRRLARPLGPLSRHAPAGEPVVSAAVLGAKVAAALLAGELAAPLAFATPDAKSTRLAQLDPTKTFEGEAQARLRVPARLAAAHPDVLAPVMVTPAFPQAMWAPLRDLFPAALLPGLEGIPNNSVMLLEADAAFIEAYMVGLNDELSRELLWREFPTDLRRTYFRQFWDVSGQLPPEATEAEREPLRDLPPIDRWQGALGTNMPASRGRGMLVLLLKGDLFLRFPTALVYAARARWAKDSTGADVQVVDRAEKPVLPHLRFSPGPGATVLGFAMVGRDGAPVTAENVAGAASPSGDPGWFFVFEEHPTEPRFGLDLAGGPLTSWRELGWPHVAMRSDGSRYLSVRGSTPKLTPPAETAPQSAHDRYKRELTIAWGRDAATMAYITLQKPFCQEMHAGYWFGRPPSSTPGPP